jgi:Methyltransferase domain
MLIYNIPAAAPNKYQDKTVTVRSDDARAMVEAFSAVPREKLWSLQVLSMDCDADALLHLSDSVQIDLVLDHPMAEFSRLYQFAELPKRHWLRVTVRSVPGMTKAVKIAQALNFSVRLEVNQPEAPVVDELITLAEYYLRGSTVGCPVEPFHSLFLSFYSSRPTSLWSLQEEDPAVDRYVTDDGSVAFSKRLVSLGIPENKFPDFLGQHTSSEACDECRACEFSSRCQGYFKVPGKGYRCEHVKRLFAVLNEAAGEMRQDEERFVELHGSDKSDVDASGSLSPTTMNQHDPSTTMESSAMHEATDSKIEVLSSFSMRRLDYRLEEFTRHSWANEEARVVWEPRIRKVCACLAELEWRLILEGVRACALTSVASDELEAFGEMLADHGLAVVHLDKVAVPDVYSNSLKRPREGEPFHYWCAIGRASDVQLFESAYLSKDDGTIGRLLGYPPCCIDFFNRVWVDEGFIDTTWPMAQNTASKRVISPTHLEIAEASSCHQLLRWLGLRIAIHLPCSFDCQPSIELGDRLTQFARSQGFQQEMDWLEEMLSWPVEWTALNGIAEITTPVGTISTVTDATAETYRVSYKGAGSAKVNGWTVSLPDPSLDDSFRNLEWYYADNGFNSREGMELFHEPIEKLAEASLSETTGNVLDLGCGNGVLLKKICQSNTDLIPWGIDISSANIAHAQLLTPRFSDNFVVSDIFDDCEAWSENREFQLVILSLVRLTEVDEVRREELLRRIREHAKNLLVYAYDGDGSLEELARKTGVTLSGGQLGENVAIANMKNQ